MTPPTRTLVHEGKAEATVIRVQYYDNTFLDDREDKITIKSDYWTGKVITVRQKGSAFLTVSEEDLDQEVTKAGGDHFIHIKSNQDWSAKVTDGDWVSVTEGATGNGTGTVTVNAAENSSELRYAEVTVYDRHNEAAALIKFTQDGVQLVPLSTEIRAGYDQAAGEVEVLSNAKWTVTKESATDDWFEILTPTGEGNGKIQLSFTQNDGDGLRSAVIILKNVVAHEGDYAATKEIVVKQAYKITPVRVMFNADELGSWSSDWTNAPAYNKDLGGTLFTAKARLHNGSKPFGNYTFHWSAITQNPASEAGVRVRHWFCFDEGCELKADIRPADGKVSFDFNAAGDGNKPSIDGFTAAGFHPARGLHLQVRPQRRRALPRHLPGERRGGGQLRHVREPAAHRQVGDDLQRVHRRGQRELRFRRPRVVRIHPADELGIVKGPLNERNHEND